MPKSLVSLGLTVIFLLLSPTGAFGQTIELSETIRVDPAAKFKATPRSFCITEDNLFLLLDNQSATINLFEKKGNSLKFIKAIGPRFGEEEFVQPFYCFYSQDEGKLGVIDYGARKVFIFDRRGKVYYELIKSIDCPRLGYDMEFSGDGEQVVISGYIIDKSNTFDLYSRHIRTGQISYLLPSHQKYNLKTNNDFLIEFKKKQRLPAIGIKAYIDILPNGDDLFFVWEGALRVIKINLRSKGTTVFGYKSSNSTKANEADEFKLADSYAKGDYETTLKERKKRAYARNIFATSRHVFLVYETAKGNQSRASKFRMQIYSLDGKYEGDTIIPGTPGRQMWFDKENYELYAFSEKEIVIFKYKININK